MAGAGLIYLVFTFFFIYVFPSKFPPNDSHTPQSILFWSFHLGDWGDYYRVADTSLHQFYQDPHLDPRPDVWVETGSGPGVPERRGSGSGILDWNRSVHGIAELEIKQEYSICDSQRYSSSLLHADLKLQ